MRSSDGPTVERVALRSDGRGGMGGPGREPEERTRLAQAYCATLRWGPEPRRVAEPPRRAWREAQAPACRGGGRSTAGGVLRGEACRTRATSP